MEERPEERDQRAESAGGASDYWAAEREQESWLEKAQKAAKAKKEKEKGEPTSR
jgi:hypothetical protein